MTLRLRGTYRGCLYLGCLLLQQMMLLLLPYYSQLMPELSWPITLQIWGTGTQPIRSLLTGLSWASDEVRIVRTLSHHLTDLVKGDRAELVAVNSNVHLFADRLKHAVRMSMQLPAVVVASWPDPHCVVATHYVCLIVELMFPEARPIPQPAVVAASEEYMLPITLHFYSGIYSSIRPQTGPENSPGRHSGHFFDRQPERFWPE